jgi:chromosome segregation ATPase
MTGQGGPVISAGEGIGFEELEERIRALAQRHRRMRQENRDLQEALAQRDRTMRELEEQIRELNQRRQDAAKRLDELIARVRHLDERLAPAQAAPVERKA